MSDLTVASLQNLEDLLSPLYYGNEEALPSVPPGTPVVPSGLTVQSFLSQDCMWGCIFNGPVIRCFPVKTHPSPDILLGRGRIPVVINTAAYHFPGSIIKCATELSVHSQRSSVINKLLLGLDCANNGGALAIYDPIRAVPLKWISLPAAVTSVIVLSHFEDGSCNQPFFNESMMAMVGVAAVGLQGGKLLLVDLGLDHLELNPEVNMHTYSSYYHERKWDVTLVEPHEPFIAQKRRTAAFSKRLIYLDVGNQAFDDSGETYDPDLFYYLDKTGSVIGSYDKKEVFVSCMQFVPNIGCLVVGYNFGGLQIWRVDDYQLEFSTDVGIQEAAVHSIEFQQPIDDPKNFCYLWILHGTRNAELQHSHAVLYALFFKSKTFTTNNTILYENIENCVGRLSIHLQDFYNSEEEDTNHPSITSPRHLVRPLRMWNQGENLTFFSWESNRDGIFYIGIFDLNQWYSSQTPSKLECVGQLQLNPYWAAISFQNPIDFRKNICSQFWDVRIVPRTMERWENQFSKHDIHLYPASLTFQAVCLSASGTYIFEYFCIQEKLLRLIQKDGYHMMAESGVLRKLCQGFGLEPVCSIVAESKISNQFFVFTALLENHRPSLIIHMASRWVDGSMANLGCDIELILKWVAHMTIAIRCLAEEHWTNLVKFRHDFLPPDTSNFVTYSNFIWNQLKGILDTLIRHDGVSRDQETHTEITKLQFCLGKLIPYSSALLMMHRARVLPVMEDWDIITPLKAICDERRTEVSNALENCPYLETELRQGHTLLIDFLLENFDEDFLREEWDVKPGEHIYPPKHPAFVFNMLLGNWVGIDQKVIARVIFYFILDVMNLVGHHTTLRGDFASLIQLTSAEQQEVVQLWRVDHSEFHDPLTFLSQGFKIDETDGLPWSAAIVHMLVQGSEEVVIEILRRCCPPKLGKLFANLVCQPHPRRESAFIQLVSSSSFSREQELLFHCFQRAEECEFLANFVDLHSRHTPVSVQQALISYLERQQLSFTHQGLLLLYFLRRKDDTRAVEQFDKMKRTWTDKRNFSTENRRIWDSREIEINRIISHSSRKHVMEFLGYTPQKSIPKPPTIDVKGNKFIPSNSTPKAQFLTKPLPAFKRLMEFEHMRQGATPLSPLRRYSGRINKVLVPEVEPEISEPQVSVSSDLASPANDSSTDSPLKNPVIPDKIDLDKLLKSPHVAYRKVQDCGEDFETNQITFASPFGMPQSSEAGLHSIMKKDQEISLRKKVPLKTRFEDLSDPEDSASGDQELDADDDADYTTPSPSEPFPSMDAEISEDNQTPDKGFDNFGLVYIPIPIGTNILDTSTSPDANALGIDFEKESESENDQTVFETPCGTPESCEPEQHSVGKRNQEMSLRKVVLLKELFNKVAVPEVEVNVSVDRESETDDKAEYTTPPISGSFPQLNPEIISVFASPETAPDSYGLEGTPGPFETNVFDIASSCTSADDDDLGMDKTTEEEMKRSPERYKIGKRGLSEDQTPGAGSGIEIELYECTTPPPAKSILSIESENLAEAGYASPDPAPDSFGPIDTPGPFETNIFDVASGTSADTTNLELDTTTGFSTEELERSPERSKPRKRALYKFEASGVEIVSDETNLENINRETAESSKTADEAKSSTKKNVRSKIKTNDEKVLNMDYYPRRLTRKQKAMLENSQVDLSSLGDPSLDTPSTPLKRGKSEQRSSTKTDEDVLTLPSPQSQSKIPKRIRSKRSGTPDSDVISQFSGDITSMATVRRITRSQSRARSEASDDDVSIIEGSLNRSDSDGSILDCSTGTRRKVTSKSRSKTVEKSVTDILESQYADKVKAGLSKSKSALSRNKKANSEPRDLGKAVSTPEDPWESWDTGFLSQKPERRAIFGYAPNLTTVIEDSESSQILTPHQLSSRTRMKLPSRKTRLSTRSTSLGNIAEELTKSDEREPGPSRCTRRQKAAMDDSLREASFEETTTTISKSSKRMRSGSSSDAEYSDTEEKETLTIRSKRRKKGMTPTAEDSDAESDISMQSHQSKKSQTKTSRSKRGSSNSRSERSRSKSGSMNP